MRYLVSTKTRLFLTAWLLFAIHFSTNIVREHYPAFALVKHGTLQVDEHEGLHPDIFVHTDGHAYINNNVATSVLAAVPLFVFDPILNRLEAHSKAKLAQAGSAPAAVYQTDKPMRQKFFREVSERGLALRFGAAAVVTSVFLMAPLSALCVVAIFQILCDRGVTRGRALWLAFVFGFGTPLFFRTAHLSNNLFVMYFSFAAFWLLWQRRGQTAPVSVARLTAAGFWGGMAVACDYSGVIPLSCLFGYVVLSQRLTASWTKAARAAVFFVLGSILPISFLLYSQWAMYGHPLFPGQYWMPAANYTDRGWRGFSGPSPEAFLLNLFHPSYGLYLFGPLLLLGLIPAVWYKAGSLILPRPERIFVAGFALAFLLFCAANQYSLMQWNTGFRYLLPLVPFIYLAACDHLARLSRPVLAVVTVPALLHTWVLCMARDCNPIMDTWRLAPSFRDWLAQLPIEAVPASYLRVWSEGLQLPWLRVLRQTSMVHHPLLTHPLLPAAVLAACGLVIFVLWRGRREGTTGVGDVGRVISGSEQPTPVATGLTMSSPL